MQTRINYYSRTFKLQVVEEVLRGVITKEEARKKYGIKGKSAILNWMRKFEVSTDAPAPDFFLQMKDIEKSEKEALLKRISELEQALGDAQLKSEVYSKMIEVAERELKISIRKKSSTKQSEN